MTTLTREYQPIADYWLPREKRDIVLWLAGKFGHKSRWQHMSKARVFAIYNAVRRRRG